MANCKNVCNCPVNGLRLDNNEAICIYPGNVVILGRFSTIRWNVCYGWFSYEGNRRICGWYLSQVNYPSIIKPIQETDLYDIYKVEV